MTASAPARVDASAGTLPADLVGYEVARVCAHRLGPALRAVILTGSLARGEGTFVLRSGLWEGRSDAEFLLVLTDDAPSPDASALEAEVHDALLAGGVACRPELTPTNASYLRGLKPHIFAYELITWGRVLFGDVDILRLVPPFAPEAIPLEDGWRLLSNRMVEMLEWPSPLPGPGDPLPEAVAYRTVKLCLDTATSLLLFQRAYAPTYRARSESLHRMAEAACDVPLPLREFAAVVAELTQLKLDGWGADPKLDWTVWRRVVSWAHALWCFELTRLLDSPMGSPVDGVRRLGREQRLAEKLRGWLFIWRAEGWIRGARVLPRIVGRLWKGSPRYQLYGVAAELFRELPNLVLFQLPTKVGDSRWHHLGGAVPLVPPRTRGPLSRPAWQDLAADILWNYRRFLMKTRS